jgi:hypothetical protein
MGEDRLALWAKEICTSEPDIAMVLKFEPSEATAGPAVCLVMRDGPQVPWHAAGKGIDGMAYSVVPGGQVRQRLLAGEQLGGAGARLYLNFCDARGVMFAYDTGAERLVGEPEVAGLRYRILYPERDRVEPLPEFFYLWGEPAAEPPTDEA